MKYVLLNIKKARRRRRLFTDFLRFYEKMMKEVNTSGYLRISNFFLKLIVPDLIDFSEMALHSYNNAFLDMIVIWKNIG